MVTSPWQLAAFYSQLLFQFVPMSCDWWSAQLRPLVACFHAMNDSHLLCNYATGHHLHDFIYQAILHVRVASICNSTLLCALEKPGIPRFLLFTQAVTIVLFYLFLLHFIPSGFAKPLD